MSVEIRLESSWDTDDGEGRRVEITVCEHRHPSEDPREDSRFFASGDLQKIKRHLCELVDRHAAYFPDPDRRDCDGCGRLSATPSREESYLCPECSNRERGADSG